MTNSDLARLIAGAALAPMAAAEAREVQAEQLQAAEAARATAAEERRRTAIRYDEQTVTWGRRLAAVAAVATVGLGIWAWYDGPSMGQIALHIGWTLIVVLSGVVLLGVVAIIARWPWDGRGRTVSLAIVAGVAAVVVLVFAVPRLMYENVMGQGFNFADRYYDCGEAVRIPIRPAEGADVQVWQLFRGTPEGSTHSGCRRVSLYKNKEVISHYDLPDDGTHFLPNTTENGETAMFADLNRVPLQNSDIIDAPLDQVTFYARTSTGMVVSVSPAYPELWRP
ncbi:hypothetical protein [Gordonia alkaliphila]|uniref:Uncharacterized protein n=1 Tax=Gordonia alkaliphila TaxID=1053547 RepID=A0ABP8ZJL1_9ACTN